jgi:pilus assembly protein CpaD
MARLITSASLISMALAISACSPDTLGMRPEFAPNANMYSENQPVVQRTDYVIDVSTSEGGVPGDELGRLADWFDSLQLRYGDSIFVEDSYEREAVRQDIQRLAAHYGLLVSPGAPVTAGQVQPGSARIIVSRATASVPNCPNWRQKPLSGAPITTESNFGCATNSNLAAMIANPNDLVLGQEGSVPGDAATATKAIKSYRDAPSTGASGLDEVSTKGGN